LVDVLGIAHRGGDPVVCGFERRGIGALCPGDVFGMYACALRQDQSAIGEFKRIVDPVRDEKTRLSKLARDAVEVAAQSARGDVIELAE